MSNRICRESSLTAPMSLTNSVSTTRAFVMGQDAGGVIYCITAGGGTVASPQASGNATLHFFVDPDDSGTRYQLHDDTNTAVSLNITTGRCYALPDALFGAGKVHLVLTGTNNTLACHVRVGLKT